MSSTGKLHNREGRLDEGVTAGAIGTERFPVFVVKFPLWERLGLCGRRGLGACAFFVFVGNKSKKTPVGGKPQNYHAKIGLRGQTYFPFSSSGGN